MATVLTSETSSDFKSSPQSFSTRNSRKPILSLRALRGLAILEQGSQIIRVDDKTYQVSSQTRSCKYKVTWSTGKWFCECADFQKRNKDCKHIFAVKYFLDLPRIIESNSGEIDVSFGRSVIRKVCPQPIMTSKKTIRF